MTYKDFPPYEFFMTVLRHAPESAYLYLKIWGQRDKECRLFVEKEKIFQQFLISRPTFKKHIYFLMEEGIISVDDTPHFYQIEFTQYDEEEEPNPKKENPHDSKLTPIS